ARFVGGDAEEPGLKLAFAVKRIDVANDGKEGFLADFFGVLLREIRTELEDEAAGGGVVQVEEFVPGGGLAATASFRQFGFGAHGLFTIGDLRFTIFRNGVRISEVVSRDYIRLILQGYPFLLRR